MTTTPIKRWYVARPIADNTAAGITLRGWYRDKASAVAFADLLYSNGVVAPLVVGAPNNTIARDKAFRCYQGRMTSHQAANPLVA